MNDKQKRALLKRAASDQRSVAGMVRDRIERGDWRVKHGRDSGTGWPIERANLATRAKEHADLADDCEIAERYSGAELDAALVRHLPCVESTIRNLEHNWNTDERRGNVAQAMYGGAAGKVTKADRERKALAEAGRAWLDALSVAS